MEKFQGSLARSTSTALHAHISSGSTLTDQFLDDDDQDEENDDISLHQAARDGDIDRLTVINLIKFNV